MDGKRIILPAHSKLNNLLEHDHAGKSFSTWADPPFLLTNGMLFVYPRVLRMG
jgi:hypothetical protein